MTDASSPESKLDQIHQQDCLAGLREMPDGWIDLAFADPPFNIGYEYDVYDDRRQAEDYLDWSRDWITEVVRVLKPDGTFWLAIGDEFAAELKVLMQGELGLSCRSWVIWYYTFGVNCKYKFSRSHAHLFYMVKDRQNFTFNVDDPAIRVPSARQLVYGDKRANPRGRLPDDTWIVPDPEAAARFAHHEGFVLRPQDAAETFLPEHDTWYYPRVNGTFKERAGWHGCQMPEQILGRIIRACSRPGDVVLDPFAGSGTTLAVAKKLDRRHIGFELSEQYANRARERLAAVRVGDPLNGVPNPLTSAPATADGVRLDERRKRVARRRFVNQRTLDLE